MRPINGIRSVRFSQVFNQNAWDQLCQKNATLRDINPARQADIALSGRSISHLPNHPLSRQTGSHAPGRASWLSRFFRRRRREEVGLKLFKAYIASLRDDNDEDGPTNESPVDLSDPEYFRIACAFVAAGVCRFDGRGELVSTDTTIDRAVIDHIDEQVNGSVTRLAYTFIALNKTLPAGFLELCFKPNLVSAIVAHTDIPEAEAVAVLDDLMASNAVSIRRESDITLEHVMELKNRLRLMGLIEDAANYGENEERGDEPRSDNKPPLPAPEPLQHYRCDRDDAWLIDYQVEHHRFLKFGRDFVRRVKHWAQRNKRLIGLEVAEVLTFAIVTGVTTGGVGTAVYFGSKLAYKLLQVGWGALMDTIRSRLNKLRLRRVEEGVARLLNRPVEHLDSRDLNDIALLDTLKDEGRDKATRFLRFTESLPGNRKTEDRHRAVTRLLDSSEYFARKTQLNPYGKPDAGYETAE